MRELTKLSRLLFTLDEVYVTAASPSKVAFDTAFVVDNYRIKALPPLLVLVTTLIWAPDDRLDLNILVGDNELASQQKEIWAPILSDIVRLKLNEVLGMDIDEADTTRLVKNCFKPPLVVGRWQTPPV